MLLSFINGGTFGVAPGSFVLRRPFSVTFRSTCSKRIQESKRNGTGQRCFSVECKRGGRYSRSGTGEGRRPNRVGELIRREVGKIIDDTVAATYRSDTGNTLLISVVDVKCSSDLRNARLSISVLGSNEERRQVVSYLRQSAKEIRFQLAQSIRMKYIPDLSFVESELADATNTITILNQLAKERERKSQSASSPGVTPDFIGTTATTGSRAMDDSLDYDAEAEDALIFEDDDDDIDNLDGLHIVDVEDADEDSDDMQGSQQDLNISKEWFNETQTNRSK